MESEQTSRAEPVSRLFGNKVFRVLLAVALCLGIVDDFYGAGKAFYDSYPSGSLCVQSSASPSKGN